MQVAVFIIDPSEAQSMVPVAGLGVYPVTQASLNAAPDWLPNVEVPALCAIVGVLHGFAKSRTQGRVLIQ